MTGIVTGQALGVETGALLEGTAKVDITPAGSLGHALGHVYGLAGANYCECFVWVRIAGRNVAALKSWR